MTDITAGSGSIAAATNASPAADDYVSKPLAVVAGLAILAMVGAVGFEVISRTFFGEPTSWATEYSIYFMIAAAFLGAGYTHREDSHVRADIVLSMLSPSRKLTLELVGAWAAFLFVALATWTAAVHVHSDFIHDTRTWGVMQTPMWVPKLAMPIGLAGLMIAMLGELCRFRRAHGLRLWLVPVLTAAAFLALPFLRQAGMAIGPLDWETICLLLLVIASAGLWSGARVMLLVAGFLLLLGLGFYAVAGGWVGGVLMAFIAAILVLLALGIRIAFAIGLIGAAGIVLLLPIPQIQIVAERAWSSLDSFSLTALPMFVLMGAFLLRSGLSTDVFAMAAYWLRRVPGGLAHASVLASSIFAAVSGSSVATAATIGAVACPEMEKRRYHPRLTYGVVAAGGTLGILIPPSIALLIYGSTMGVSISALFIAGIVPGLLLTASFMVVVAIWVKLRPVPMLTAEELRPPPGTGWRVTPVTLLVASVLGSMYLGIATPTEAGGVGAIVALLLCLARRDFGPRAFVDSVLETVRVTSLLLLIVVATGIMTYVFDYLHVATSLVEAVRAAGLQPWLVALGVAGVYVLLGMFIDPMSMMLMTLPVAFPLTVSLGHDPVWFGIVLVILIEVGLVTPPVGMNLFVLKGIAPKVPLGEIAYGSLPFVVAMAINLVLIYIFPGIVTWLPSMMR